ncbi:NUMOD4 domain-containing protein, partial [Escherichia coli]
MLSENAKDIPGFEGVYAVTEDGRVYSHSRVVKAAHGSTQLRKGRWLKPK